MAHSRQAKKRARQAEKRTTVNRARLVRNRSAGVFATGPTTHFRLEDVEIHSTKGHAINGEFGRGLQGQEGATIVVVRGRLEHNREAGILAGGHAEVRLRDVATSGASRTVCATQETIETSRRRYCQFPPSGLRRDHSRPRRPKELVSTSAPKAYSDRLGLNR